MIVIGIGNSVAKPNKVATCPCIFPIVSLLGYYIVVREGIVCMRVYKYVGTTSASVFFCLLYTSPSPRDRTRSRMPSSA